MSNQYTSKLKLAWTPPKKLTVIISAIILIVAFLLSLAEISKSGLIDVKDVIYLGAYVFLLSGVLLKNW